VDMETSAPLPPPPSIDGGRVLGPFAGLTDQAGTTPTSPAIVKNVLSHPSGSDLTVLVTR
jgi:hypothetical protein